MATGTEDHSSAQPSESTWSSARPSNNSSRNDRDQQDATELDEINVHDYNPSLSSASISSNEYRITPRRTRSQTTQHSSVRRDDGPFRTIRKFWTRNVVLTVPQKANRDHFALERTFLAYIRTSVATSMLGVLIAQLFRLQRQAEPPPNRFGFYSIGIPLSLSCHAVAILIAGLGAHRFWKQQSAIALGKVYVGGWEVNCIGVLMSAVVVTVFVLAIAVVIELDVNY